MCLKKMKRINNDDSNSINMIYESLKEDLYSSFNDDLDILNALDELEEDLPKNLSAEKRVK